jgi:hypothetical protein
LLSVVALAELAVVAPLFALPGSAEGLFCGLSDSVLEDGLSLGECVHAVVTHE